MTLTHGSLFSGVGGFDLGADAAGIETLWQAEIDKKASSVLARHWPNATRYGDVKEVKGDKVKPVDIISFGSPCQDLSIAGKGAGLQGSRSGLFFEAVRVIKEMRDATQNQYPQIAIWENVRGALSSNEGKDFHAAIQALAQLGAVDISYRLVNACHFGVPQRRVRVFVVADFGGERAGQILAKPTRLLWHPSKSREPEQEATGEVEGSTGSSEWQQSKQISAAVTQHLSSGADDNFAQGGHLAFRMRGFGDYTDGSIASTTKAGDYKDATDLVVETSTLALTERAGKPGGGKGLLLTKEMSPTLRAGGTQNIAEPVEQTEYRVRRLTPVECERLMGWPDNHTKYDKDGNELTDSARYKMCGNGIAAPVAQWLCENIVQELT
jgi:DNA (cytosine-5)-methyltransferase 1